MTTKKIFLIIASLLFVMPAFSQRKVRGNGVSRSLDRKVDDFRSITVGEGIDLQLLNNEFDNKITIISDANLIRLVEYKVIDGNLNIKMKEGFEIINKDTNFLVKIPKKSLDTITISENANLEGIGVFKFDDISIINQGSGTVKLNSSCNNLTLENSGSGSIVLEGNARTIYAKISGSGVTDLSDFSTFFMELDVDASGDFYTNVVNGIDGKHKGSGTIYYKNTKTVNIENLGSGAVKKQEL